MAAPLARVTVQVAVQSPSRLLRDTLSSCLNVRPGVSVVGMVAEPDQMPALCELRRPDVAIFDAGPRLSEISGPVGNLMRRFPELNVIVTYRDASQAALTAACQAGVASLVPEAHGLEAVLALVRRRSGRHARPTPGGMTDRELEVLMLTASGHSGPEIGSLLGISPLTVDNLKRRIYAKLDVNSGAHAVSRAASLGILDQRPGPAPERREPPSDDFAVLTVVAGEAGAARDQVLRVLVRSAQSFVLVHRPEPLSRAHWARWHRGPIVAALVDPEPDGWSVVHDLGVPAILVHSKPLGPPEVADALTLGASSLVSAETIDDHFLSVLRMASQGYLVVDSLPDAAADRRCPRPLGSARTRPRRSARADGAGE